MCSPVNCNRCGKVTWTGCGAHIEQVLAPYTESERCNCNAQDLSNWLP